MNNIPRHIAIIPDGNRRYAKARGKLPWEGHREGAEAFRNLVKWCKNAGVHELTFWAASTDNLERDRKEVDFLLRLFDKFCNEVISDFGAGTFKEDVSIRFYGNLDRMPSVKDKMLEIQELTKNNKKSILNFLVAYGGRDEILKATRSIALQVANGTLEPTAIDEKLMFKHLFISSEPDLIIRTSQQRLSGLLPFQSVYSEIIFLDKLMWPEFSEQILKDCIEEYANRKRTFGH